MILPPTTPALLEMKYFINKKAFSSFLGPLAISVQSIMYIVFVIMFLFFLIVKLKTTSTKQK